MPQSIAIGLLVLGGVLLLVGVTGGKFKLFGEEVDSTVSSTPVRLLAGVLGVAFVLASLTQGKIGASSSGQTNANNQPTPSSSPTAGSLTPAASATPVSGAKTAPAPQTVQVAQQSQPADSNSSGSPNSSSDPTSAANSDRVTSSAEYAVVFDPPSNIRSAPSKSSDTLCSVTSKTAIRILGSSGNWYQTDICSGRVGYIYRNQVKF